MNEGQQRHQHIHVLIALFCTLEFFDKKHLKFDQGLDFLIFYQGNRGQIEKKPRKQQEKIRKIQENLKIPGPYFLFNIFLFNIFGVFWPKCRNDLLLFPVNVQEISRTCPGLLWEYVRNISGTFPEKFRKRSGKVPEHFRNVSRTFRETFRKHSGTFPEMS